MSKLHKYGVRDFEKDFPSEEACIERVFLAHHTRECSCGGKYALLKGRRQYQCSRCRYQIAPTANTIFHKSDTPLRLWFVAILMFSNAKSGYSAKQLERELNVTYKTAWRMLKLIRGALKQSVKKLKGIVEIDETYFGGRFRSGRGNKLQKQAIKAKSVIAGAIERGGSMKASVAPNSKSKTLGSFIDQILSPKETILMTDSSNRYEKITRGFERHFVDHSKGEYARGGVHVNSVESFWSHIKRSITGTHKAISKKYLQSYLYGFVFHYNNRGNDNFRFSLLLGALLRPVR